MVGTLENVEEELRLLAPEIGSKKANSLWKAFLVSDDRSFQNLLQLKIRKELKNRLGNDFQEKVILLPPPSQQEAFGSGEIYLGDILYGKQSGQYVAKYPLYLNSRDLTNHTCIVGPSGFGKTQTAYGMALQLLDKGIPWLCVDWDRSWRNLLSLPEAKVSGIQVFTVGRDVIPFLWNLISCIPPGIRPGSWIGIISKALEKSHLSGQGVADFTEQTGELLLKQFLQGISAVMPNFDDIRREVSKDSPDARKRLWWQSAMRIYKSLTRDTVYEVFNSRKPLDIASILTKPTIIELDKSMPENHRILFQEMILTWINLYRAFQGETQQLRHVTFMEEFSNMLPNTSHELNSGFVTISGIFKEMRKFGEGLVILNQEPSELPNYVVANCKTHIHFTSQTKKDIIASASCLNLERPEYLDLLGVGHAIVKIKGRFTQLCHVRFKYYPTRTITDEQLKEFMEKNHPEIITTAPAEQKPGKLVLSNDEAKLLCHVGKGAVLTGVRDIYESLGWGGSKGNNAKNGLLEKGLVKIQELSSDKKGGITKQLTLTVLGMKCLNKINGNTDRILKGKGSVLHKELQDKIARIAQEKGLQALIEYEGDDIRIQCEVKGKTIRGSLEIQLNPAKNLVQNALRNTGNLDFKIFLLPNKKSIEYAKNSIQQNTSITQEMKDKISFHLINTALKDFPKIFTKQ